MGACIDWKGGKPNITPETGGTGNACQPP